MATQAKFDYSNTSEKNFSLLFILMCDSFLR